MVKFFQNTRTDVEKEEPLMWRSKCQMKSDEDREKVLQNLF